MRSIHRRLPLAIFCLWGTAAAAQLHHGPDTCAAGFVWREAFQGDRVCVTPETRAQAAADNSTAPSRWVPGPYGPYTCVPGYVWREAGPGDLVCVAPETRDGARDDNNRAAERLARNQPAPPPPPPPPPPAPASCTIYEHRDFGGAQWVLGNGDYLKMVDAPDYGISDGIHRFLYEPSWNDVVSSFRVEGACVLTLWQHLDHGGARFEANQSHSYVGDAWNDQATEVVCECAGLPNW